MTRKEFLHYSSMGSLTLPSLVGSFLPGFHRTAPWMRLLQQFATETDHVLVLVRMDGGNDGLNTVIPLDQYDTLANVRSQVVIPENRILRLNGTDTVGFHPALEGLRELYEAEKLAVIQSVGYPNPNFSHFRSTDIWMTGADSDEVLNTGWMGRYLHYEYPNFPNGFPNNDMPDPLSIEVGSTLSLTFQGPVAGMGMSVSNPDEFYNLVQGIQSPAPDTPAGKQLEHVRLVARQSNAYGQVITSAYDRGANIAAYPDDNPLAAQLKAVARLISGGLKTRIYLVSIGGFDTHDSQVDPGDHTIGEHADLLRNTSEAIRSFMEDISALGHDHRVLGMTFSEFGRRIISNLSYGTDHGAAAPMFLFGSPVKAGIFGDNPFIPANATVQDNLPMQFDFRSVYATVLKEWFCIPEADLETVLLSDFQSLPLIDNTDCMTTDQRELNQSAGARILDCYPNPFTTGTTIRFEVSEGHTQIQVFNMSGQLVARPAHGAYAMGLHELWWNSEDLPPGTYYVRLQNGLHQQVRPVVKVR